MNMTIETMPTLRIAFVRQVGPYGPANVQAMEKIKKWAKERNLLTESAIIFGIPLDDPKTVPPEYCRYDASIVISNDLEVDDGIGERELSGGTYVICRIKHTAEEIQKAWAEVIPYLQENGYQIDNRPILERYMGEWILQHFCELCVPIKPLSGGQER